MDIPKFRNALEREARATTFLAMITSLDILLWIIDPKIQREFKCNPKVQGLAKVLPSLGAIPGTITLGVWEGKVYVLDGQHRLGAYQVYLTEGGKDSIRAMLHWIFFDEGQGGYAAMGKKFDELQMVLSKMTPDDSLRPLEHSTPVLQYIRKNCGFVGYDRLRKAARGRYLSMAVLIRAWLGSGTETPVSAPGTARDLVRVLSPDDAKNCTSFANLANEVWGAKPDIRQLWNSLNLTICMWLYRRMVLNPEDGVTALSPEQFKACVSRLSRKIDGYDYAGMLQGLTMNPANKRHAMSYHKKAISAGCREFGIRRVRFPEGPWQVE